MRFDIPAIRRGCRATVIVPVHNEEARLSACLESLHRQTVPHGVYETILLLNNCSDGSVAIAENFRAGHPGFALHCISVELSRREANVGTARRLAMDQASRRLSAAGAILSTDGDTKAAPTWVEANLKSLEDGADLVGGDIAIAPADYKALPANVRGRYDEDARYQTACTRLESLLDPDPFDKWPRHYHHFGASLACTNRLYEKLRGLPRVDSLEDVAFVNAAVRADARVRHSPAVRVWTTARTSGRATVGFASQLREWGAAVGDRVVDSGAFLTGYFQCRSRLRRAWAEQVATHDASMAALLGISVQNLREQILEARTFGELHDALDLRGTMWRRMPKRLRVVPIRQANQEITALCGEAHRADSDLHAIEREIATPGGSESIHVRRLPQPDNPLQRA